MKALVEWIPWSGNREADSPANGVFDSFDPALGVPCGLEDIHPDVLPQAPRMDRAAEVEVMASKSAKVIAARAQTQHEKT